MSSLPHAVNTRKDTNRTKPVSGTNSFRTFSYLPSWSLTGSRHTWGSPSPVVLAMEPGGFLKLQVKLNTGYTDFSYKYTPIIKSHFLN